MLETYSRYLLHDFVYLNYKLKHGLPLDYYDKYLINILDEYNFIIKYRNEYRLKNFKFN